MLDQLLTGGLWSFMLVFARIGSAITLLPGFGEAYVSPRVRLGIALAISFIVTPLVADLLPALPGSLWAVLLLIGTETVIGLLFGTLARLLLVGLQTAGMIIAPCSIKTLAALATCHADTLVSRAGDVTLKEGRPLLALVRETPLHVGHLRQMLAFAEMGGIVFPPVPAFYQKPRSLDEVVSHTVARVLERMGLAHEPLPEWTGGGRKPSEG